MAAAKQVIANVTKVPAAGTRVPLGVADDIAYVIIAPLPGNTGVVYLGDDSVASTKGYTFGIPGSNNAVGPLRLEITSLDGLYLDSAVNNEGVSWIAVAVGAHSRQ